MKKLDTNTIIILAVVLIITPYIIFNKGWLYYFHTVAFVTAYLLPLFIAVKIYLLTKKIVDKKDIKKTIYTLILQIVLLIIIYLTVFTHKESIVVLILSIPVVLLRLLFLYIIKG